MLEDFFAFNDLFPWFFPSLAFVFGAITGSFLNVCILRIPLEKSIVSPGSQCICGRAIPWYHNIPILSWIFLRGRCHCPERRPFSIRYPAVELLTAVLFLACWLLFPPGKALAGFVFISILICATFIDFDHMIIPDRFTIGGFLIGVFLAFLLPSLHDRESYLPLVASLQSGILAIVGGLIGSALILWIGILGSIALQKEAMGFGDVKFIAAIGAFTGWQGAVFSIFGGALIGILGILLWKIVCLFRSKPEDQSEDKPQSQEKEENANDDTGEDLPEAGMISFGPMLAAGALVYFLFLDRWVDQYFAENAAFLFPG